jgi:hypothetical protein
MPYSWMGVSLLHDSIALYSYHETGKNGLETGLVKYMIAYSPSHTDTVPSVLYKYIFTADKKHEELYELISDPGETNNLVSTQTEILQKLRSKVRSKRDEVFGND